MLLICIPPPKASGFISTFSASTSLRKYNLSSHSNLPSNMYSYFLSQILSLLPPRIHPSQIILVRLDRVKSKLGEWVTSLSTPLPRVLPFLLHIKTGTSTTCAAHLFPLLPTVIASAFVHLQALRIPNACGVAYTMQPMSAIHMSRSFSTF